MNINAIRRNCMKRRTAIIMDAPYSQWICNGTAAWLVEGLRVDEEAVAALFNLTHKQRDDMYIRQNPMKDPRWSTDWVDGEETAKEAGMLLYHGDVFVAIRCSEGVLWIHYDAVKHIKEDYRAFAVRWKNGEPIVAVYGDLFCEALVMPLDNRSSGEMHEMAAKMAGAAWKYPDPEKEAAEAEEAAEDLFRGMQT